MEPYFNAADNFTGENTKYYYNCPPGDTWAVLISNYPADFKLSDNKIEW